MTFSRNDVPSDREVDAKAVERAKALLRECSEAREPISWNPTGWVGWSMRARARWDGRKAVLLEACRAFGGETVLLVSAVPARQVESALGEVWAGICRRDSEAIFPTDLLKQREPDVPGWLASVLEDRLSRPAMAGYDAAVFYVASREGELAN